MKKFLLITLSTILITGCSLNETKNDTKEPVKDTNVEEKSNVKSNKESNVTSNKTSNVVSNVTSNKPSNTTSNTVSNKTSNVVSNVTSNKTSNVVSNKPSNTNSNVVSKKTDKTGTTSKGYTIEKKNGIYYVKGILIANKTYDLPSTYNPGTLLSEFNTAYQKMKADYDKQGFKSYPKLSIRSGFRSYSTQKSLYNNYVARDGKAAADRYSARPGYSEHQTGLAADLNVIDDNYGNTDSGKWLANNCWRYGFILRYPKGKESQTGYMYESWHFRYIGDLEVTKALYNNGNWLSLEEYLGITSKYE